MFDLRERFRRVISPLTTGCEEIDFSDTSHRWISPPPQGSDAIEVERSGDGVALMRDRDDFYWLDFKTPEGHFVSGRKDLLLTVSQFSETLRGEVPIYRREPSKPDEHVQNYRVVGEGLKQLITSGHVEALRRERLGFSGQVAAVGLVGVVTYTFLALESQLPPAAAVIYGAAALAAGLIKAGKTSVELQIARKLFDETRTDRE